MRSSAHHLNRLGAVRFGWKLSDYRQSSPDTGSTQYTYDAKGNLLTSTDARGKTTTYVYDSLESVEFRRNLTHLGQ